MGSHCLQMTYFLLLWHWQWAWCVLCTAASGLLVQRCKTEIIQAEVDQGPVDKRQSRPCLCCSCVGRHTESLALRPLQLFSLAAFFMKSAFRNVYSLVHVCFYLICAPHQEGLWVCVGRGKLEKFWDEFPEQIRGWWSLINYLLDCTLTHFNGLGVNKAIKQTNAHTCKCAQHTYA